MKKNEDFVIQKRYILIKFYRKIEQLELPYQWISNINNIYFIPNKNYNFIEFNNSKIYDTIVKNKNKFVILESIKFKIIEINSKPLVLNSQSNILFMILKNKTITIKYVLNLLSVICILKKILIIHKDGNSSVLIEIKNKNCVTYIKELIEKMILNKELDVKIHYSKKSSIQLNKDEIQDDKNDVLFNIKHFKFKNYKYLMDKIKFKKLDLFYLNFYQKIIKNKNYFNIMKYYWDRYNNTYCIIFKSNNNEINNINIYKLMFFFYNNIEIIINKVKKLGIIYFKNEYDLIRFQKYLLLYFNNNDILFNFNSNLKNKLINIIYINYINPDLILKFLLSDLSDDIKFRILDEFYKKNVYNNIHYKIQKKQFKPFSKVFFIKTKKKNLDMFKILLNIELVFLTKINSKLFFIIIKNYHDLYKIIINNNQKYYKLKYLNNDILKKLSLQIPFIYDVIINYIKK